MVTILEFMDLKMMRLAVCLRDGLMRVFPYDIKPEHALYYFLLRNRINRKILYVLVENESIKQAEIPKLINELKGSVYYHINSMIEEKIIVSEKKEGMLEISLNPYRKGVIIEILGEIESKFEKLKKKHDNKEDKPLKPLTDKVEDVKIEKQIVKETPPREIQREVKIDLKKETVPKKDTKKKENRERIKTL